MQFIFHLFSSIFSNSRSYFVFCLPIHLFYPPLSQSLTLVSFQCPSSALFISSEHLPWWQVAGGGGVDVPWLPYTLLSFCLVLIHGHPKLLTLSLCPHSDSPFGCSAILLYTLKNAGLF